MQSYISLDTPIDLHMHTTYSDGRWSAEDLFDYLAQEGFGLIAVTDHDHVDMVEHIHHLSVQKQIRFVAGVEVSAEFHGQMADVLCFGFDPHHQRLRALTEDVRQRQKHNAEQVYEELQRRGYRFPYPHNLRVAGQCGTMLVKQGVVPDWPSALALITDAGYCEMKADIRLTVEEN